VSIKPITSDLNNSGTVHFAYFPRSSVGAIWNGYEYQMVEGSSYENVNTYKGKQLGLNAIDTAPYH